MYWANAIILNTNTNQVETIFTYKGDFSIEDAENVIKMWKQNDNIKVLCAYIKDDTGQVIYLENNVNALGIIEYKEDLTEENEIDETETEVNQTHKL